MRQRPNDVDEASRESFPASDAPAAGGMSRVGTPPRDMDSASRAPTWWSDGLLAGLLGFAAIVVTFTVADVSAGRSAFHTVAALGSALVLGASEAAQVRVSVTTVAGYTVAHLLVFLAIGVTAAWLVSGAERRGRRWFVALFLFVVVALHLTAAAQALAAPMRAILPGTAIWVAGIAAGIAMAGYLIRVSAATRR
jgi:hypothetical protein